MKQLLDTDICIFLLRGHAVVCSSFDTHVQQGIGVSVVTLAELRYGAACSAKPEWNQQLINR